jgi:hypothetical protein
VSITAIGARVFAYLVHSGWNVLAKRRPECLREWRASWLSMLMDGALVLGGYLFVLFAPQRSLRSPKSSAHWSFLPESCLLGWHEYRRMDPSPF